VGRYVILLATSKQSDALLVRRLAVVVAAVVAACGGDDSAVLRDQIWQLEEERTSILRERLVRSFDHQAELERFAGDPRAQQLTRDTFQQTEPSFRAAEGMVLQMLQRRLAELRAKLSAREGTASSQPDGQPPATGEWIIGDEPVEVIEPKHTQCAEQPLERQAACDQHYDALDAAHPDWLEVVNGADFRAWLGSLPKDIQPRTARILDAGTAAEVIRLLDLYKQARRFQDIAEHTA
jgi:hypothetical protein